MLIDPEDTRIQTTWGNSKECFAKAINLFPYNVEQIEIPYEGTTLPGHFYHYKGKAKNRRNNKNEDIEKDIDSSLSQLSSLNSYPYPTLVVHGGFDSTLEELYSSAAAPALDRGYNCLAFEGPGQGGVIRKQQIPFRYDWEKVVSSVIDYAIKRKDDFAIDTKRIALMGISMGGYLAARAAAFDHRISACILYNGVYDGFDASSYKFSKDLC